MKEQFCVFLENNLEVFLSKWNEIVVISESDMYKDKVYENGRSMVYLVLSYIRGEMSEQQIEKLADQVALELLQANVNIGEFVYNVNLGRSELLRHLSEIEASIEDLQPIIVKINKCFDLFLFFAIRKYTELKNKELEEKNLFINQTHKDRLTILGQMSASFVHEFRNPLTAVMGFTKLLKEKYPELEYIDIIANELEQLNYRITQFLLVSKKEVVTKSKEKFSIQDLIQEILDFIYPSIVNGQVHVHADIDPALWLYGYRDEIRQVIINIILNSIDALENRRGNRKLSVCCKVSNGQLQMCISNNGPAIPARLKQAIFEPFVTTKELGTGIGLYVCKQIIEKHGGWIHCDSSEDITTFSIVFDNHDSTIEAESPVQVV
ncbi:histidine kinase N-terminal domain-containing protein [Effusibacillus dendaii]|uniref:histidine kinase N-terminal domain-containing protein n=1 Tax=Effusibacillus dendaii TaxID=2743772 RepID=UPI001CF7C816|nr:histidine kinase N-terminal domain-containing protein [Effusibacillus dendaii]